MIYKTVELEGAKLTLYVISNSQEINMDRRRPMILIVPGGGYRFVSDREAEPVALRFLSYGYNCAVLDYAVNKDGKMEKLYPTPLIQLGASVKYIRDHAEELNTIPSMVCTMGFSAGGHLAAMLGCLWKPYGKQYCPDAQILCYPVLTSGEYGHKDSFRKLCGNDENLIKSLSIENLVTSDVPQTFIWHIRDDKVVPVQNTLLFKEAMDRANVPCEMHIFEKGGHGMSLASREVFSKCNIVMDENVPGWTKLAHLWLVRIFGENWY